MAIDMNVKELMVIGDFDLLIHQVQGEWTTKNIKILPYLHCVKDLCKKFTKIEFKHIPRIQNEFVDPLATMSSMIQHPNKNYIDPIEIEVGIRTHTVSMWMRSQIVCHGTTTSKGSFKQEIIQRMPPMIHGDFIQVPPNELNVMGSLWSFTAWGMDVIGPVEPDASNRHRFILVAIEFFTKWVKASTYKVIKKKVVAGLVCNNIVYRFEIPESFITDNAANLNSVSHEGDLREVQNRPS
ncbi:uncharacterized protein [Nicotiana tomentosiformis]|uniref:uncharacterized protein n=1 Tax=Nicotiana tomentosiformis TaxID=4098 RepID=UPI00388C3878